MPNNPSSKPGLHLALIPDGNRRWAREHKFKNVWKGHEQAIENFRSITEWCRKNPEIKILTVWCFSTENWQRDPAEITMLMNMLEQYLRKEQLGFIDQKTRFVHSGRRDRIPPSLKKLIEETEELTKDEADFTLNLAVDYGGKDEILRAIQKGQLANWQLAVDEKAKSQLPARPKSAADRGGLIDPITDKIFRSRLDHPELPDIDLVLRSAGEMRTSNFSLWQSAYAEWIFSPKYFPDIDIADLEAAMEEYHRRKRRFGF